jgi:type II secretory pathway pseudopilin PulG
MNRTGSTLPPNPQGSALVLSLVFIAVFASLATALLAVSGASVQLAENLRKADATRASAESGLEVMRYWLSQIVLTAAPEERFNELETMLRSQLPANLADEDHRRTAAFEPGPDLYRRADLGGREQH